VKDKMQNTIKLTLATISFALITGCATSPVVVNSADPMTQLSASNFAVKPGLAKVYFVGGQTGSGMSLKVAMAGGAQLIVDGNKVGQIDRGDVMVLDVVPNTYNFSWQYPSGDSKMNFLKRQVKAGDVVILQANWNTGGAALGLIGAAMSPAQYQINEVGDRGIVAGKRFVKPSTCPTSICN
jgi:hypothetical protein